MVDPDHDPESLDKVTELDHDPESLDKVAELLQTTEKHRKSSNLMRLSVVSRKYDLDNTGLLNEHEKELRAMDQGKKMRSPQVVVVILRCLNKFR